MLTIDCLFKGSKMIATVIFDARNRVRYTITFMYISLMLLTTEIFIRLFFFYQKFNLVRESVLTSNGSSLFAGDRTMILLQSLTSITTELTNDWLDFYKTFTKVN
jgi:hypothetical protein